jgi:hypothetical protein
MSTNGKAYGIDSPGAGVPIDIGAARAGDSSQAPAHVPSELAPASAVDLAAWGRASGNIPSTR